MCGIVGVLIEDPGTNANQMIFDGKLWVLIDIFPSVVSPNLSPVGSRVHICRCCRAKLSPYCSTEAKVIGPLTTRTLLSKITYFLFGISSHNA